jgi:hypothetical protein
MTDTGSCYGQRRSERPANVSAYAKSLRSLLLRRQLDQIAGYSGTSTYGYVNGNICHPCITGTVANSGAASVTIGTNIGP